MKYLTVISVLILSALAGLAQSEKETDLRHREQAAQIHEGIGHKEIRPAEKKKLQREQEKIQRYEDRHRNSKGELSRSESRKAGRFHDEAQKNINESRNNGRGKKHKRHS